MRKSRAQIPSCVLCKGTEEGPFNVGGDLLLVER
jgi:hypothetical protein